MPVLPSWLTEPLWDQFAAPLPQRPEFDPAHPLGCHRRRINDRTVFGKLPQVLRFGCSCEAIADSGCSATTIRSRRDDWIRLGVFARLEQIALEAYDRVVGLVLDQVAVDGAIAKAPGGVFIGPDDHGRGRSRGGLTAKIHLAVEQALKPMSRVFTARHRGDSPQFQVVLSRIRVHRRSTRSPTAPRTPAPPRSPEAR